MGALFLFMILLGIWYLFPNLLKDDSEASTKHPDRYIGPEDEPEWEIYKRKIR